jgi:hypothetical protein
MAWLLDAVARTCWVTPRSRLPAVFGHEALTAWPVIFLDGDSLSPKGWAHEVTHAVQQLAVIALALPFIVLLAGWSWVGLACLVGTLLHGPYRLLYWLSCVPRGYHGSIFEMHARAVARAHWRRFTARETAS